MAGQEHFLSFAELDRRANRLARHLRRLGVGPDQPVAVCMTPSPAMLVGQLGILKAGAAYAPLDPGDRSARLPFMIRDLATPVVVTEAIHQPLLAGLPVLALCLDRDAAAIAGEEASAPAIPAYPDGLAYVLYTSGSTGQPKGSLVSHRSLANFCRWHQRTYGVGPGDRATKVAGPAFDVSVWDTWPNLGAGATLLVPREEIRPDPEALVAWIVAQAATVSFLPTPLAEAALRLPWPRRVALRALLTGGDRLLQRPPAAASFSLWNIYGPAECTIGSSNARIDALAPAAEARGSGVPGIGKPMADMPGIGKPMPNARIHLLDGELRLVPWGVHGQLSIGGLGVARGYFRRPRATAAAFCPDAFGGAPGGRLYRTGDLARYRADGSLEFLGRADFQVKLRGVRIELGEVEAALLALPAVREAVVLLRGEGDARTLAAFVVAAPGTETDAAALRAALRQRLPEVMVPAAFVSLPALPLTANGKVDRAALLAIGSTGVPATSEIAGTAPRDEVESQLAAIWHSLLGGGPVHLEDDFFARGGHSLLAAQMLSRVRRELGVEVPLRALFETPTLAALARTVRVAEGAAAPIEILPRPAELPLSSAQQRLWFLQRMLPENPFYNVAVAWQLDGPVDRHRLRAALAAILDRHEALRTRFPERRGRPVQEVVAGATLPWAQLDLGALAPVHRAAEVLRLAAREARRPFDLEAGGLMRATLLHASPEVAGTSGIGTSGIDLQSDVLLLTLHHVVTDGWSLGVLLGELSARYGGTAEPPPLSLQYPDFALWQRRWLAAHQDAQLDYWRRQLAGAPVLELPTDRPRPSVQRFRGGHRSSQLSAALAARVAALAQRCGATPFIVLLAAFGLLLERFTSQRDLMVGTPVAGRHRAELEPLIGFFVNTLALRLRLGAPEASFRQLVAAVREVALGAYGHQDLPFEVLVEDLHPQRDLSRNPLFQVLFTLQNTPLPELKVGDLRLVPLPFELHATHFDLELHVQPEAAGFTATLAYDRDLFDATTMARLDGHFQALLSAALAAPDREAGQLPLLSPAERQQLLRELTDTRAVIGEPQLVHRGFELQVARRPEALAATAGDAWLSFAELDRRASQVAHRLRRLGVTPDMAVAVLVRPGLAMLIGQLGVLKAGAGYAPLDPTDTSDRLPFMIRDLETPVVVTERSQLGRLAGLDRQALCLDDPHAGFAGEPAGDPNLPGHPLQLAYAIFTSGSTGRPKSALLSHRAMANFSRWHQGLHAVTPADRASKVAGPAFDAAVWDSWANLTAGASLWFPPEESRRSPVEVLAWMVRTGVTLSFLPTPLAEALLRLPLPANLALRRLITGGDRLLQRPPAGARFRFWNVYGPTECTIVTTCAEVGPAPTATEALGHGAPAIGRPIPNLVCHLLDHRLRPVAAGVHGEVYIAGAGLARGYHRRPRRTAGSFVPHPLAEEPGQRAYRTGDLARLRPDGSLDFVGRVDFQVKVRGFRIELGEVEAALAALPAVRDGVVIAPADPSGRSASRRLLACLTLRPGHTATVAELRAALGRTLPDYMVPALFLILDHLPVNANGKVDRQSLAQLAPTAAGAQPAGSEVHAAPRSELQRQVAAVWQQVLGVPRVGLTDNFFDLGGTSMLMVEVQSRLSELLGQPVPIVKLFEHPTVGELCAHLRQGDPRLDAAASRSQADRQKEAVQRQRQRLKEKRRAWDGLP